jgi:ribonuclease HI
MLPKITTHFQKTHQSNQVVKVHPKYDYKMNFDGCSKGNPGLSGAGAVIYHFDKEIWSENFFVGENFTNNRAEYAGLILGLQQAKAFNIKHLIVEGDSLLVINQMKGIYQCRAENLILLYETAKDLEKCFENIEYCHVLRSQNKRADELSNIAVEKYLINEKT